MIYNGHIQMVYILHFGAVQIQGRLTLNILIYSHGEPSLGKYRIECNFGIEDNISLSIQGKCRVYQEKKREGPGEKGSD